MRSEYDKEGNRTRVTSNLGADIRHAYDRDGYLQSMQAGEVWKASWMRDSAGLEMQRTCSGGITVRTERDRFGRETRKSVRSGSIERAHGDMNGHGRQAALEGERADGNGHALRLRPL